MSSGRVFQTRGPATVKARLPTVESLTGGTSRRLVPAERNVRRAGRSATGTRGRFGTDQEKVVRGDYTKTNKIFPKKLSESSTFRR